MAQPEQTTPGTGPAPPAPGSAPGKGRAVPRCRRRQRGGGVSCPLPAGCPVPWAGRAADIPPEGHREFGCGRKMTSY